MRQKIMDRMSRAQKKFAADNAAFFDAQDSALLRSSNSNMDIR